MAAGWANRVQASVFCFILANANAHSLRTAGSCGRHPLLSVGLLQRQTAPVNFVATLALWTRSVRLTLETVSRHFPVSKWSPHHGFLDSPGESHSTPSQR